MSGELTITISPRHAQPKLITGLHGSQSGEELLSRARYALDFTYQIRYLKLFYF